MNDIKLTVKQIKEMKHALGGDISETSYRNYYNSSIESESWNELVQLGMAVKRDKGKELGGIYYFVTKKGIQILKSIFKG
jgi:hypothetical protein